MAIQGGLLLQPNKQNKTKQINTNQQTNKTKQIKTEQNN